MPPLAGSTSRPELPSRRTAATSIGSQAMFGFKLRLFLETEVQGQGVIPAVCSFGKSQNVYWF